MTKRLSITLLLLALAAATAEAQSFPDWKSLHNPVLSYPNWSIKDVAMASQGKTFYVFFSAFYQDHGRIRSHVVEVSTRDFKTYSQPILNFDGEEAGWIGMCSPDVQKLGNTWELSFNSWGDQLGKPNQLFYMTSSDLVHWSPRRAFASNLTAGQGVIDLSITRNGAGYYAIWKQDWHSPRKPRPRLASAKSLRGPWHFVESGYVSLAMADGNDNGLLHENFEFIWIDGVLHLLTNDYLHGPRGYESYEYLYTLLNPARPLDWGKGFKLAIDGQAFNQLVPSTAGALYDWRKEDGYYYLIYAGRNDETTYLHRGWNRLALARSKDLTHWNPAGTGN